VCGVSFQLKSNNDDVVERAFCLSCAKTLQITQQGLVFTKEDIKTKKHVFHVLLIDFNLIVCYIQNALHTPDPILNRNATVSIIFYSKKINFKFFQIDTFFKRNKQKESVPMNTQEDLEIQNAIQASRRTAQSDLDQIERMYSYAKLDKMVFLFWYFLWCIFYFCAINR